MASACCLTISELRSEDRFSPSRLSREFRTIARNRGGASHADQNHRHRSCGWRRHRMASPRKQPSKLKPRRNFTASCSRTCKCSASSPDGKTFVDAIAKDAPAIIVQRYHEERHGAGFDLAAFVARNFTVQRPAGQRLSLHSGPGCLQPHRFLWSVLARMPDRADPRSSLLPLPYPYVVPGGRFNEIYYWDSYFTMLGLEAERPPRHGAQHGPEFRQPDHALRPHPERQSHLLSQSLAAPLVSPPWSS